jgi:hypothetical protein
MARPEKTGHLGFHVQLRNRTSQKGLKQDSANKTVALSGYVPGREHVIESDVRRGHPVPQLQALERISVTRANVDLRENACVYKQQDRTRQILNSVLSTPGGRRGLIAGIFDKNRRSGRW